MKYFYAVILTFTFLKSWSCSCTQPTIENAYRYAVVIFYGRVINTGPSQEIYNLRNDPMEFDTFEVFEFFKGVDNKYLEARKGFNTYKITLKNPKGGCEFQFEKDKFYLVYAKIEWNTHLLYTQACRRTTEIKNSNFFTTWTYDPDFGKEEAKELRRLYQKSLNRPLDLRDINPEGELTKENSKLAKQLFYYKSSTYFLLTFLVLVLLFFLFKILSFKFKKST